MEEETGTAAVNKPLAPSAYWLRKVTILRKRAGKRVYVELLQKLSERIALSRRYHERHGVLPRLKAPRTFSEKIQWRKLYQRHPDMPGWIDKASAKEQAGRILGDEWIIPTLYAGPSLPFDRLDTFEPPFIIKPSHGSGPVIVVRDNAPLDWSDVACRCAEWTRETYGASKAEWAYSRLTPGLIIEEFIGEGEESPPDYKFYVFHGRVEFVHVDTDRVAGHKRTFFDRNWNRQDFTLKYPLDPRDLDRPASFEKMLEAAERIGRAWDFVRVDFYDLPEHPKFGEVTFYPDSGLGAFSPAHADLRLGKLWRIAN